MRWKITVLVIATIPVQCNINQSYPHIELIFFIPPSQYEQLYCTISLCNLLNLRAISFHIAWISWEWTLSLSFFLCPSLRYIVTFRVNSLRNKISPPATDSLHLLCSLEWTFYFVMLLVSNNIQHNEPIDVAWWLSRYCLQLLQSYAQIHSQ